MTIAELELPTTNATTPSAGTMKALVYHGPGKRAWEGKRAAKEGTLKVVLTSG